MLETWRVGCVVPSEMTQSHPIPSEVQISSYCPRETRQSTPSLRLKSVLRRYYFKVVEDTIMSYPAPTVPGKNDEKCSF